MSSSVIFLPLGCDPYPFAREQGLRIFQHCVIAEFCKSTHYSLQSLLTKVRPESDLHLHKHKQAGRSLEWADADIQRGAECGNPFENGVWIGASAHVARRLRCSTAHARALVIFLRNENFILSDSLRERKFSFPTLLDMHRTRKTLLQTISSQTCLFNQKVMHIYCVPTYAFIHILVLSTTWFWPNITLTTLFDYYFEESRSRNYQV